MTIQSAAHQAESYARPLTCWDNRVNIPRNLIRSHARSVKGATSGYPGTSASIVLANLLSVVGSAQGGFISPSISSTVKTVMFRLTVHDPIFKGYKCGLRLKTLTSLQVPSCAHGALSAFEQDSCFDFS